jgi:hypothetical protein
MRIVVEVIIIGEGLRFPLSEFESELLHDWQFIFISSP